MSDFLFLPHQGMTTFLLGLLGLLIGSFLNVVIHRLPRMIEQDYAHPDSPKPVYNLLVPRSACAHCGHQLGALENIPLLSYVWLRGQCKACAAKISLRYPLIELLTALIFAAFAWHYGFGLQALGGIIFCTFLLALTAIDLDTFLLPDALTLPLLWLGLLFNLNERYTSLPHAVLGAVLGYLILWLVYWGFKWVTGKEGMGYGDFKLLAALGAWLGWQMLPVIILLSSLVGAVVGVVLIALTKRSSQTPIPFGPYLAAAGLIAFFFGKIINQHYLQFVL